MKHIVNRVNLLLGKVIMRKTVVIIFAVVIVLFIGVQNMETFGAGIFYPRLLFSFENLGENFYWGPADKAIDMANDNTPEINIWFRHVTNNFYYEFQPIFLTKSNYSQLYVKEIIYVYDDSECVVLSDALFKLTADIREINDDGKGWITNGAYYWMNGWEAEPEDWTDKSKLWPRTNFEKIFNGKMVGDVFSFAVKIIYKFDDDAETSIIQNFQVTTMRSTLDGYGRKK